MLVNISKHSRLRPLLAQEDTNQQSPYGKKPISMVHKTDNPFQAEKISKNLSSVAYFISSLYLLLIVTIIIGQLLT